MNAWRRFDVIALDEAPGALSLGGRRIATGDAIEVHEFPSVWSPGHARSAATIEGRDGIFLAVDLTDGRTVVAGLHECRRPERPLN